MSLFDLISQDGIVLKKMATTNGGEYAGPCPFCGGNDRFRVWPEEDRYWCRQCQKAGDSIQYLRDAKGMKYHEACLFLNIEPKIIATQTLESKTNSNWTPKKFVMPEQKWKSRTEGFLSIRKNLNKNILQWLKNRGLSIQTIKNASLAWNPEDVWLSRKSCGLLDEINKKTGNLKTVWLPKGLIIPAFLDRQLIRLRFRRPKEDEYGKKYIIASGSSDKPMFWKSNTAIYAIVESELDGFLLHQEAGDLVNVIALGSAQARPDKETYHAISEAKTILLCLDYDEAGTKESWGWWLEHFKQAVRWPCPVGKDPGEAFQKGLNIRAWIQAGLLPCG